MFKKTILVALLGLCTQAQAELYNLSATYTGLTDYNTGVFDPARTATLRAVIDDVNGDGKASVDEVRSFSFPHVSIGTWNTEEFTRCGSSDGSSWCLEALTYAGGNALTFNAWSTYRDFDASTYSEAISGEQAYYGFHYTSGSAEWSYDGFYWAPQTQVAISFVPVAAVPEPSTYAMLGVGLCAVGALARRRHARVGNQARMK